MRIERSPQFGGWLIAERRLELPNEIEQCSPSHIRATLLGPQSVHSLQTALASVEHS